MNLIQRPIELHSLPISRSVEILHPERVILVFGTGSLDLGAFCYEKFSEPLLHKARTGKKSERLVDPVTLIPSRVVAMRRVLNYFSEMCSSRGLRSATVYSYVRYFVKFLDWADCNGYPNALVHQEEAKGMFSAYVDHLRHLVNTGQVNNNTVAVNQNKVLEVLSDLLGQHDLHHGLNLLRTKKHSVSSTEPAPESDQARVLSLCECLFDGLGDLCLEFKPYPYAISVPPSLNALNNLLWVFPGTKWCEPPHKLTTRSSQTKPSWAFDFENGRLASIDEIKDRYIVDPLKNTPETVARNAIEVARQQIECGNADRFHRWRMDAAMTAHNSFLMLFLANTGMNLSSVQELQWTDAHEIGADRQGFRSVKFRANGRIVSFEIQAAFLKTFRKFLLIRSYLLQGANIDRLFVSRGKSRGKFQPLSEKAIGNIVLGLQRIDPEFPDIKSRKWRASKSDWLLRNTDPATTAVVLQNSETTVLASYAMGSSTSHIDEMGQFFERLGVVLERGMKIESSRNSAVGVCTSFGFPNQSLAAPIESNCEIPEGCLFCDHFRVHADEVDVRKLLSCRYCVRKASHIAVSEEQFQDLFIPILNRIEFILQAIEVRQRGIVVRIEKEVEEGELDPYWAAKLEMLINLNLIS